MGTLGQLHLGLVQGKSLSSTHLYMTLMRHLTTRSLIYTGIRQLDILSTGGLENWRMVAK